MGGYGSGRWGGHNKRIAVEECRVLDIGYLRRKGLLRVDTTWRGEMSWSESDGEETARIGLTVSPDSVRLQYTITWRDGQREPEDIDYAVPVVWTPCNFGGRRPWFVCSGRNCGRRVGKLYSPCYALTRYYLCRHCYGLSYQSRQRYDKRVAFFRRHPMLALATMQRGKGAKVVLAARATLDGLK